MLKCNIKRGGNVRVKASGTAEDIMVETCALIQDVYQGIKRQNPEAAKGYKNHLIGMLLDPDSPVWKEEDHAGP